MEYLATIVLLVISTALTILHFLTQKGKLGSLINKIPGPSSLPIIGNTLDIAVSPESLWKAFRTWADDYYPIFKFWIGPRPAINIRHPDDVEVLLNSQENISKSLFYNFLHPWINRGLLTSTGDKWRSRRKMMTPAFHFNVLSEFISVFVVNSERMVETLKEESGEVVKDIATFCTKFTLNAICESAMGTTLTDTDAERQKYRDAIKLQGDIAYYRATRPWLSIDWIFALTQKGREQRESLKVLHDFSEKVIRSRKSYHEKNGGVELKALPSGNDAMEEVDASDNVSKKRLPLLDLLISVQKMHGSIDDFGIREEIDTFMFEGHDTIDMGLTFTVLLLAEHKEIQAKARAEVDAVLKDSNGQLRFKELQNLSYLDRCVKEALRMFPPVPLISREITSDMQLKKFFVPRGTIVNLSIFDVHQDPNFWPQPDKYDPDRFLADQVAKRHPFSYVPFSGGLRNCIGQKFAMLELKVFTAMLLHNFYLEPMVQVSKTRMLPDLVLKSLKDLNVKFVPIR